ncbi:DUF317 domain-containing protein [Streptacidiphilus jiangxiensis]|uniref:DUF317 domain-containing protein n=1 Tax=Streptacidiphilus jiangxiensis TaxID=235985 RepID=A0A1H8A541_STRJI|nr:DUF317 domain-containing protein [Streptacidiphilus jiangxiensis]SEM65673.1 protein of unknown function [Streptacidiphilus jiangxiensis]
MTDTPTSASPPEPPGRRYLVSPRYLAGPGEQPEQALAPLLQAGWTPVSDVALDGLTLLSPDLNTLLRHRPDDRVFAAWTVYAFAPDRATAGAVWTATFTWDTPVEIVTGFTTALARADRDQQAAGVDPFAAFGQAGWSRHRGRFGTLYTERRYLADASQHYDVDPEREMAHLDETWLVSAPGGHGPWIATASRATPAALLSALARATVDRRPVTRTSLTGMARGARVTALPALAGLSAAMSARPGSRTVRHR